jgi:RNA polymerase sigma-70 factor (ECF subfamily)
VTDDEIIDRILSGDRQAFSLLVSAYEPKARALARRLMRDEDEARDLVQDAFVKAYSGLAGFRRNSSFATWFYRIVYTTCLNALQRSRRLPTIVTYDEETSTTWIEPAIFDGIDAATLEEILRDEMERMPPLYAAVMELFYAKDCSYDQIAKITGMPLGTVKTRLNRGRSLLRTAILQRCPDLEHTP